MVCSAGTLGQLNVGAAPCALEGATARKYLARTATLAWWHEPYKVGRSARAKTAASVVLVSVAQHELGDVEQEGMLNTIE